MNFNEKRTAPEASCGAVQILEMTLILPLVLSVASVLILFAMHLAEAGEIRRIATKYATAASAECACPGYISLLFEGEQSYSVFSGEQPSSAAVSGCSSEHRPYRYFDSKRPESFGYLEKCMKKELMSDALAGKGEYNCKILLLREGIGSTVTVSIEKERRDVFGGLFKRRTLEIRAIASVADCSEFVRNTDTVCDLAGKLWQRLGLGGEGGIKDRVGAFFDSFSASR